VWTRQDVHTSVCYKLCLCSGTFLILPRTEGLIVTNNEQGTVLQVLMEMRHDVIVSSCSGPEIAFSWVRKWIMTYGFKRWVWLTAGAEMRESGRHVSSGFNTLNPFSSLLTQHLSQHPHMKQLHCCMLCSVPSRSAANTRVWPEVRHSITRTGKFPNRLHSLMPYCTDFSVLLVWGHAVGANVWGTALQAGRLRVRFPTVSLELFIDIILQSALWSWGRFSL